MTDFFYWGGPVYCKQADNLAWQRPTKVFCHPLEGSSNGAFFSQLGADPLTALLTKAGLDPASVGSVGFGGFSAFHGFLNPMLAIPAVCERTNYVHLADACFGGAGATEPKSGFLAFAKRAVAGKARMTVTTNGPWGKDISYMGPEGSKYAGQQFNLTSGAKCFQAVWDAAAGSLGGDPEPPAGIPAPARAYRKGELYWWHYETGLKDPHGGHVTTLAQPIMQMYGVPWMASPSAGFGVNWLAAAAGGVLGYLLGRAIGSKYVKAR
jgi:hypothetical protein